MAGKWLLVGVLTMAPVAGPSLDLGRTVEAGRSTHQVSATVPAPSAEVPPSTAAPALMSRFGRSSTDEQARPHALLGGGLLAFGLSILGFAWILGRRSPSD